MSKIIYGPWKEIVITDWNHFEKELNKLPYREWVYRGHSDANQGLKTSLYRLFDDIQKIIRLHKGRARRFAKDEHEQLLIERFKTNAHLYLNSLPKDNEPVEWLAIMQHYGAPTRLLDVTLSPYIASYFALETKHCDCCVFAFNHAQLKALDADVLDISDFKKSIFKNLKSEKGFIIPYVPRMSNERLEAQQGLFLIPSNNYETFEELLEHYGLNGKACIKFIIPMKLRYEGLQKLRGMNITSASLFPGLDGFCRSLKYQILEGTGQLKSTY